MTMNSQIRTHECMISDLLEELSKNYNKIYNLKGIRKQKKGESYNISDEELKTLKYIVDTKMTEILQEVIELRRLVAELNGTIDIIRYRQIRLNPEIQFCYRDDEFGEEYWSYSSCLIELRNITRISKLTASYNKSMCDTIRRPFTVLGYEIKRIEQEYNSLMTELKKRKTAIPSTL